MYSRLSAGAVQSQAVVFINSGARLPFGKVMAVCILRTVIQFSTAVKEPFTYSH
jgi:hypothetical protein